MADNLPGTENSQGENNAHPQGVRPVVTTDSRVSFSWKEVAGIIGGIISTIVIVGAVIAVFLRVNEVLPELKEDVKSLKEDVEKIDEKINKISTLDAVQEERLKRLEERPPAHSTNPRP